MFISHIVWESNILGCFRLIHVNKIMIFNIRFVQTTTCNSPIFYFHKTYVNQAKGETTLAKQAMVKFTKCPNFAQWKNAAMLQMAQRSIELQVTLALRKWMFCALSYFNPFIVAEKCTTFGFQLFIFVRWCKPSLYLFACLCCFSCKRFLSYTTRILCSQINRLYYSIKWNNFKNTGCPNSFAEEPCRGV